MKKSLKSLVLASLIVPLLASAAQAADPKYPVESGKNTS